MWQYFTVNTLAETLCFVIAIVCLAKDKSLIWQSMIIYLLATCIAEILGILVLTTTKNNNWVYNIFLVFETGFNNLMFFYLFSKYIKSKPLIISGLALFSTLYLLGLNDHGFMLYNDNTYAVMSIVYVFYSLYYYYLLIKDEHYLKISHSPEFWWVAGTLFFYFANTTCNLYEKKFEHIMITSTKNLTYFIFAGLNIILYSLWSYSFICRRWETTMSKN